MQRTITVPSNTITLRSDLSELTPAMTTVVWEIAGALDEARIESSCKDAVWLNIPSSRLRGESGRQDNTWLKECLHRLTGLKLEGSWKDDEWGAVLLAEWHLEQGGAMTRLLIPPAAIKTLNAPETFAKIEAHAAHTLGGHARRIYAILADKKRLGRPYWKFEIDELRALIGVDDKKAYERFGNFNQKVLKPALEQINDLGTVSVTMRPEKWGRSVKWVRFDWCWKDPHDAAETAIENEKHRAARRKQQEAADAPPMIEDEEQVDPALTWWGKLTDVDREAWTDRVGRILRTEGPGGKIITAPRREADIARDAFKLRDSP